MSFRFGSSYYPQHRESRDWSGDLDLMVAGGFNAIRLGDFAWSRLEPADGRYEFGWLDEFLALAGQKQVGVLLIPPIRCAPAWLVRQDPTIGIVNDAGVRLEFGSRYTFCINHPGFRAKGLELTRQIAARYAGHRALIGWHLDNEYGDEPDCHCDHCRSAWHAWLAERYGEVGRLNAAWGTVFWSLEYSDFAQVPTPRVSKTYHQPALMLAWRRFRSQCTIDLMRRQRQILREHDAARPITTNLQCLWNPRTDYYDLPGVLDVAGLNYYPPYGPAGRDRALGIAVARGCVGPGVEIHELRNGAHAVAGRADNTPEPGEVERLTLHTIAHGADAIYYFQWAGVRFGIEQTHGTIVGYDGRPNRVYAECQRIGRKLQRMGGQLAGTRVVSDVAVLYDFPTRWLMHGGPEWVAPGDLYVNHAVKLFNAARRLGVSCDAVGRSQEWGGYKVLIVPALDGIDDATVEKLDRYVAAGRTLLWHPLSGIRNPDAEIFPSRLHPGLERLLGISLRECATAGAGQKRQLQWGETLYTCEQFMDLPAIGSASVVATYVDPSLQGAAAVTENRHGRGRAIHCGTFADAAFYRAYLERLFRAAGVRFILGDTAPADIEVAERTGVDGQRLIFLINATPTQQRLSVDVDMNDLWNEVPLGREIHFEPWQVRIGSPARR